MAEVLGTIGFAIAVPGIALAFAQYGRFLEGRIRTFQTAPRVVEKLESFAHDLYEGKLKVNIDLAEWALQLPDLDPGLKTSLESQLVHLHNGLEETKKVLDKIYDKNGHVKRIYFVWNGERCLKQTLKKLEKWQTQFWRLISLLDLRERLVVSAKPDQMLLTSARFRPFCDSTGRYGKALADSSYIVTSGAEIMENQKARRLRVLIEAHYEMSGIQTETVFTLLSHPLSKPKEGLLKCLGYRRDPRFELIFEIPHNLTNPRTLRSIIANDVGKGFAGGRPLDHRFRLARKIAEAVLSVHIARLVHKNIRPETIVLFQNEEAETVTPVLGEPYLTNWSLLRDAEGLSTRGGIFGWQENLYRHPKRHGPHNQARYNMGHDVYSLGAVLLEIGLWEPLIVSQDDKIGEQQFCDLYRETAIQAALVSPEHALEKVHTTAPLVMQSTLVALAQRHLPQRMGILYSELVVSCLTCLEGGFGDGTDFEESETAVGVKFNQEVLHTLESISF